MKNYKNIILLLLIALMSISMSACDDNQKTAKGDFADTVVYGTIRTADTEYPVAEAIAVKEGKFIYVGDETDAAAYIKDGVTKVIDSRGKGMVMPGCTDGHSHYTMKFGIENMKGGLMFAIEDDKAAILQKLDKATLEAKKAGKQTLFGFGWNLLAIMADPPTLEELDNVTHGVSTIIFDQGGHHAFCNSECLKRSGIIDGKGRVLIKEIDGGYLALDDKGYPTGYAEERVTGYMMRMGGIDYNEIVDDEVAETAILKTQDLLLSTGYTMALDGWSNMLHPSKLFAAANRLDKEGRLKIVFPMTYEVEPWQTDISKEIDFLASLKKDYGTNHVLPEYLKIFMDGVVETKTGALLKPYKNGTVYKSFWSVDRLAEITKECNAKDLTVHTHVMGDAAIKDTTDAYIQGGNGTHRNCMVHLRNVLQEDFRRFADNNIACSAGLTWHIANGDVADACFAEFLEPEYIYHGYPIKSFFDAGVMVSSHSDYPANKPCPQDPFGIMEIAVTGQIKDPATGNMLPAYDKDELITIDQAFQALTINGAWQLGLENERGSIKVGKWADFVLTDRDVFTCKNTDIGKTKVVSTWFEGKLVYSAPGSEKSTIAYLNADQNETLNSARPVPDTDNQAYEINYTADYKMDEFIKTITEKMLYHTTDCRMTMKKLLANRSGVDPLDRLTNDVPGCSSVVCRNSEGVPVIGRNYDLDIRSNGATVVIHTAPKNGYKSVGVADCGQTGLSVEDLNTGSAKKELLLYAPYYTMDGVNEKGFACSIMLLNEGRSIQETGKNWLPSTLVVRYLLDHADSVKHAIELLKGMDLKSDYFVDPVLSEAFGLAFHWALTDTSGNKAIIEYVDGKLIVNQYPLKVEYNENDDSMKVTYPKEEKGYLLSTNFYVTEGFNNTAHDSGRWRYETLEKAMSQNPTPTDDQLRDVMKSAKYLMNDRDYMFELRKQGIDSTNPDNWDWITIWTEILNTSEKSLTLWMRENYEIKNIFKLEY